MTGMAKEPDRIVLGRTPTPIEPVSGLLPGVTIAVKRDDLTGLELTGNKVRKLEYLLAEALSQGKRRLLTCGGIQSNHCRATAVAAAKLGLASLVFLRVTEPPPPESEWTGNLRLMRLVGAEVRFITPEQYRRRHQVMADASEASDYLIPEGGSNALGAWGYIRAIDELMSQWDEPPSSILCATGSGGTLAGLVLGARRRGLDVPIHGVCVCDDAAYFRAVVARIGEEAHARWPELPAVAARDVLVVEGYVGRGYALSTPEEEAELASVARATGLLLDPVYTGKAFRALLHEPDRFGPRPLFLHTGGIFGLMA